ncbi:hypothetical protein [Primorskyibacter sp. S87]|uniref:hypothetical protein n=1 Tax=Primorskyibacter sp. S87 TaxID=3415126 RepID=UPI003C7C46FB
MFRTPLRAIALAFGLAAPSLVSAQELIDKGFVHGWNLMVDPAMGNGCLIQTVYEDLSVVRLGYDANSDRGYFVVFNKAWGDIKTGEQYNITFDLDGEGFNGVATGVRLKNVPGAIVAFDDRNFVHAIASRKVMTVYGQTGEQVMAIDLKGTAKALEYARECQKQQG